MERKIDKLRNLMQAGEWDKALSLAAKFPNLGVHKQEITRAHAAIQNPSFYKQIGQNPEALIATGVDALKTRYPEPLDRCPQCRAISPLYIDDRCLGCNWPKP